MSITSLSLPHLPSLETLQQGYQSTKQVATTGWSGISAAFSANKIYKESTPPLQRMASTTDLFASTSNVLKLCAPAHVAAPANALHKVTLIPQKSASIALNSQKSEKEISPRQRTLSLARDAVSLAAVACWGLSHVYPTLTGSTYWLDKSVIVLTVAVVTENVLQKSAEYLEAIPVNCCTI